MIAQLDGMVMEGLRGDVMYKDMFHNILSTRYEQHMALTEPGVRWDIIPPSGGTYFKSNKN